MSAGSTVLGASAGTRHRGGALSGSVTAAGALTVSTGTGSSATAAGAGSTAAAGRASSVVAAGVGV